VRTVHEHVKPFVCEFEGCGRAFGFKKVLERHGLTHTMPAVPRTRKKVTKEVGVMDEIAGTGYDLSGRDIPCSVDGCEWRFTREYDLQRHLGSLHKQLEDEDINMDFEDEDMDVDVDGEDEGMDIDDMINEDEN
jgi:general transcription factor IIIA